MSSHIELFQITFSLCVIVLFGWRQFNRWTDDETRKAVSDVELLAFAQPRSFTSLWRFVSVASLYCGVLATLYFLLLVLFKSPPSSGMAFLEVTGVDASNAWLAALFVVTGLGPNMPGFSDVERNIRQALHVLAFVPTKAQELADELGSPGTSFEIDAPFFERTVRPRLGPQFGAGDFAAGQAVTIAQKWCRLKFLVSKFGAPLLDGADASEFRSPYTTRFHNDLMSLQAEVTEFARTDAELLRKTEGSPAIVSLLDRIDSMQHRLYVLMCCRAFGQQKPLEDVIGYFRRSYGIGLRKVELSSFPTDPVFDTLAAVTLAVFVVSFGYTEFVNGDPHVLPVIWAINALATHGLGLLVGWFVFSRRRRRYRADFPNNDDASPRPLSRKLLLTCAVLGFTLASPPTWLSSIYYLHSAGAQAPGALFVAAFQMSWPWAFLGSATAVAVYAHLERTSGLEASLRVRAKSAGAQALANVVIALLILGLYAPPGDPGRTLASALAQPVAQLVVVLTGTIGLALGFFLPRVVHGHGLDLRGGATRIVPTGSAAQAVFSCNGRQIAVVVESISVTGCALRLPRAEWLAHGRCGTLQLDGKVSVAARVVRRLATPPGDETGGCGYAMQFTAARSGDDPSRSVYRRLGEFMDGLRGMQPAG